MLEMTESTAQRMTSIPQPQAQILRKQVGMLTQMQIIIKTCLIPRTA